MKKFQEIEEKVEAEIHLESLKGTLMKIANWN